MSRILVVDDEKNVRRMVSLTLSKDGHEVEAAEDAQTALQKFGDGSAWDLLLTDQRMPGLEGRELVIEARHRDPGARVIMMTAFPTIDLASGVLQAGVVDFLRKPFEAAVLRGAVKAALSRARQSTCTPDELGDPARQGGVSGQQGRQRPLISYYFNGFTFWPVDAPVAQVHPALSVEMQRTFRVYAPSGETKLCVVAITPHINTEVRDFSKPHDPAGEVWDAVCRDALINFLLEKAIVPPDVLPVYELTNNQLSDIYALSRAYPPPSVTY